MSRDVAVLGVGMHPWGKWGRHFTRHGVAAARAALADAGLDWTGLDWRDVGLVAGADTVRGGYPGNVAGAAFAQALGWQGARVAGVYAACASGAQALDTARAHILAGLVDTALVVGADAAPKGFFAPVGGEEARRPGLVALPRAGGHQPGALRAVRTTPHGAARRHARGLRPGQGEERGGRRRQPARPPPDAGHRRRGGGLPGRRRPDATTGRLRHLRRGRRRRPVRPGLRPAPRDAGPGADPRGLHRHPGLPAHGARPPGHRDRLRPRRRAP
ncbi:beta-ketoacyl synthase N-terminal-like domain-containing protein [Actinacidiphila glaucinigra]|uniref:beta-ketoacyl synthase N-terminal-like domain-containing protein n=1 Tax=Actinacidiphila glaucinigra TaxID=235986 RepID=UPI00368E210C